MSTLVMRPPSSVTIFHDYAVFSPKYITDRIFPVPRGRMRQGLPFFPARRLQYHRMGAFPGPHPDRAPGTKRHGKRPGRIVMLGMLFLGFILGAASALFLCEVWFSARGGCPAEGRDPAGYR
jgi:hypothetical protein